MLKLDHPGDDIHIIEWRLENFSRCTLEHEEELESPVSIAGNLFHTHWIVEICPKGYENPNFLSCYVKRGGNENDGPQKMPAELEFSLITFDGLQVYRKSAECEFERDDCYGFDEFIKLEDIFWHEEFFLQSDTLTLRCTLRMLRPEYEPTSEQIFTTEFPLEKLTARLTLENFHSTTKQSPRIFILPASNDLLSLKVSMNKDENSETEVQEATVEGENPKVPKSFLRIVMTKKKAEYPIKVTCWIKVLNNNLNFAVVKKVGHLFSNIDKEEWILPYFIDTYKLKPDCIVDNALLLDFDFILCARKPQTLTLQNMTQPIPKADPKESTLTKDLEDLYKTGKFSDVILLVGEVTFPAHKSILASRSPRFKEIFTGFLEKYIQVIVDVDENTMELLLKFIYTDTLEDISDEKCLLLYIAAQKYQISSLQCRCVKFLEKNLSIKAFYKALVIAEEWNDVLLKMLALDFILDNYQSALLTPEWQTFAEEQEEFANQIKRHMEFKQRQQSED